MRTAVPAVRNMKRRMLETAGLYVLLVASAELTLGNPDFPVFFWKFTAIPNYLWSVPVHLAGLFWMLFWNMILLEWHVAFPVLLATLFFIVAELLNLLWLEFFIYAGEPLGSPFSFTAVIVLYAVLCTLCSLNVRRKPAAGG